MKNQGFHKFKDDTLYEKFCTDIGSFGTITDGSFSKWLPREVVIMEQKIKNGPNKYFLSHVIVLE